MEAKDYPPYKIPSIDETRGDDFFQPYVATLKKIFAEILGWTEAQTEAFVEQELQRGHFRVWFGHDSPCSHAAAVITPPELKSRLVERRISTHEAIVGIQHVLEGCRETHDMHPDTDPDYDWQRARDEIADIIKEYENIAA